MNISGAPTCAPPNGARGLNAALQIAFRAAYLASLLVVGLSFGVTGYYWVLSQ